MTPVSRRRADLPDFENPPVTEVVLSIQFEPLPSLRTPLIGLLWREFRERFPKLEEHSPLDPVFEKFTPTLSPKVGLRVEAYDAPPLPRVWFLNEEGTQLLQIQPDRFIHNWREVGECDRYPRYERLRDSFLKELSTFRAFIDRERLGELVINQCEITYVNHILAGEGWERHGQLSEILRCWVPVSGSLPEPESVSLATRYVIPGGEGQPVGRLHVTVQPAWRTSDGRLMYVMTLTARGTPQGEGVDGAVAFLDVGREWIVRGFTDLTTGKMHSIWRRTDG